MVLKLDTRSDIGLKMRRNHIERTLGNRVGYIPLNVALTTVREGQTLFSQPSSPIFYFSELLSTASLRFEMTLKLEVASATSEVIMR